MRRSLIEYIVIAGIVTILFAIIGVPTIKCCGGLNIEYSNGSRSGVVQKISKKGFFWKTWEGELNLGYNTYTNDGDSKVLVPAIFEFSVSSDEVAKKLQMAEESGHRVTVEYKQYLLMGYNKGGTGYDITRVKQ